MQYNFKFLTGPDGEMCCYHFFEAAEIKKKRILKLILNICDITNLGK